MDDLVIDDPNRDSLERWGSREDGTWLGNRSSATEVQQLLRTKIALYDACLLRVDLELGQILSTLDRQGRLERTVVVVLSDHGEEFLDHAAEQKRNPRNPRGDWGIGHGHTLYEEQLRIPLVIMGPGLPVGEHIEESFPTTELMPTLLGWLDLPSPAGMDGIDRRAWIANPSRLPIPMAAEAIAYGPDRIAWIAQERKIIADRQGEPQLVFDLRADPSEQINLLGRVPWQDELLLRLIQWNDQVLAEAPPPTYQGELDEQMRQGLRNLGYVE